MSLICDETGRYIDFGEPLMAGTRQDVNFYSALCQEVIERIPESERRNHSCENGQGGVNIHKATSGKNFNGAYSLCGFTLGRFQFSISQEAAERYLPKHVRRYEPITIH